MENLWKTVTGIFTSKEGGLNWGAVGISGGAMLLGGWLGGLIGGGSIIGTIIGAIAALVGGTALSQAVLGDSNQTTPPVSGIKVAQSKSVKVNASGVEKDLEVTERKLPTPWNSTPENYIASAEKDTHEFIERAANSNQAPETLRNQLLKSSESYYTYVGTAYALAAKNSDPSFPKIASLTIPEDLQSKGMSNEHMSYDKWSALTQAQQLNYIELANAEELGRLKSLLVGKDVDAKKLGDERDHAESKQTSDAIKSAGLTGLIPVPGSGLAALGKIGFLAGKKIEGLFSSTGVEKAQKLVEKFSDENSRMSDVEFRSQMRELARSESNNKTDGAKAAELIDAWTEDLVSYRKESADRERIVGVKIEAAKNAEAYYKDIGEYQQKNAVTAAPAKDEASLKAAAEKAGNLVTGLATDGKDHEEAVAGVTAKAAAKKTPAAVTTSPTGEISKAGTGAGAAQGQ